MRKKIYFTPGPTELFYTVEEHIKTALRKQILSISHRSKAFEKIHKEASDNLRQLLNIPAEHKIIFTNSAAELADKVILNCVEKDCCLLINGSYSSHFSYTARQLGKNVVKVESSDRECPSLDKILLAETCELIGLTINETSTGTAYAENVFEKIKVAFPDQLIAVDATASLPYFNIDYNYTDLVFFSGQYGFGCPSGLGILIISQRALEKAGKMTRKNIPIGPYHSLPLYYSKLLKNQTPANPNIFGIYLLSKVSSDMLNVGIDRIRRETKYKHAVLQQTIETSSILSHFVEKEQYRSKTTISAETAIPSNEIIAELAEKGIVIGGGHEKYKFKHIRISNYPTHSKEQVEMLADHLARIS